MSTYLFSTLDADVYSLDCEVQAVATVEELMARADVREALQELGAEAILRIGVVEGITFLYAEVPHEPPYVSLTEAARAAGLHPATLRRRCRLGTLHAIRPGRNWAIAADDVAAICRLRAEGGGPKKRAETPPFWTRSRGGTNEDE